MHHNVEHIHKRKRQHQKTLHPFPHKNKWINFLDRFLIVIAVIGPLNALPQVYKIYSEKNAGNVSPWTWGLFSLFNIPWIIYGIVHKEKPIIVAFSIWFVMNMIILAGVLIY